MADVITRSIPALPYNGGTPQNAQPYQAAVRLNANRMVWTWCQTNPNWRFFSIIDTPEGWANGGTPAVTATRMFDQRAYYGQNLQMVRLNDTTFMVFDMIAAGALGHTVEVFEIDANNQITRTYTNLDAYGSVKTVVNGTNAAAALVGTGTAAKYSNVQTFTSLGDNKLMYCAVVNSGIIYQTITWDTTAKTLTFGASTTLQNSIAYSSAIELYPRRIAGSTKKGIFVHTLNTGAWSGGSTVSQGVQGLIFNADGTSPTVIPYSATNSGQGGSTAISALDCTMMGENRFCRVHWNQFYYFKTSDGTTDGFGTSNNTQSFNPMLAYGLDANYLMLIDRTHFTSSTSGALKVKIIRREDSNLTTQSAGSAASATGFSVTAPYIEVWRHESRPQMQDNGDLFWWGLDTSGNLTWNILKNAS